MLIISIVALVISAPALPFTAWAARATARQAKTARDQTQIQLEQVAAAREQNALQRDLAHEAAQPYVWADIQPDLQQGTVFNVAVGNSGPTMAHNIRVQFDPPLPSTERNGEKIDSIQGTLARGLRPLAPGRVILWSLGAGYDLMPDEIPQLRRITVRADGPFGPLPTLAVEVDITEWRQARDAPDGSLHHVRGAVKDLTKAVDKVESTLRRGFDRFPAEESQTFVDEPGTDA